jgi:hypothetical protein
MFAALCAASLAALVLARMGAFDAWIVVGLTAVIVLPFSRILGRAATGLVAETGSAPAWSLPLGTLAAASVIMFPSYELWGGRDQGLYTIIASTIANRGGVDMHNPVMATAYEQFGELIELDYPGIYSEFVRLLSDDPADLVAQFNHLTPAARAVAVQFAGLDGMWISSAVFAALAAVAMTIFAGLFVSSRWAALIGLALVANPAFVWVARSTLTEVYTLAMVVCLFLFGHMLLRFGGVLWGALAGVAMGLALFSRVEACVLSVYALGLVSVWLIDPQPVRRSGFVAFLAVTTVALGWSVADLMVNSWPYFFDLATRKQLHWIVAGAGAMLGAAWIMVNFASVLRRYSSNLEMAQLWLLLAAKVSIITMAVAFAVRYGLSFATDVEAGRIATGDEGQVLFGQRVARELTWYVPLPFVFAAFAGAWCVVSEREGYRHAPVLGLVLAVFVVYLFAPVITPDHPWMSRRFLSYTIPFLLMFSIVFVAISSERFKVAGAISTVIGALIYVVAITQIAGGWYFRSIQADWPEQFDATAARMADVESPYYVTTTPAIAAVLTYVYGLPTVTVPVNPAALVSDDGPWLAPISDLDGTCTTSINRVLSSSSDAWRMIFGGPGDVYEQCLTPSVYAVVEDPTAPNALSPANTVALHYRFSSRRMVDRSLLVAGWSTPETWGVWSDADTSILQLTLPRVPERAVSLEILGRAFVRSEIPVQVVRVFANNQFLTEWMIEEPELSRALTVSIPPSLVASDRVLEIKLEYSHANSPLDLNESEDVRRLALGISELWLWEQQ